MFDEAFRTLFISKPTRLAHKNNNLMLHPQEGESVFIPLRDIHAIVIDTPQVSLSSSLLSIFARYKILVFVSDDSHIPSGIFTPFLTHYRNAQILQHQICLTQQNKSILWQKIIQAKIQNQANLLLQEEIPAIASKLQTLKKHVKLADSLNGEAQAASLYFPALFGKDFSRKDLNPINAALNYGYAIVRGCIARNIVGAGLLPSLGIFHSNQFNPFNLADDLIEPYRPFVDSKVIDLNIKEFATHQKIELVNLLNTKVSLGGKNYPLHRSVTRVIWSVSNFICNKSKELELPVFNKDSNGREIYESSSDV